MEPRTQVVPWYSNFNLPALLEHAGRLRNVPCSCDVAQQPQRGSLNWASFLSFEDEVEWVFRSPATEEDEFTLETVGELLESEVATMKYIRENSYIPIPHIFDYSSTASNLIGIPYILMSKAPGTQLQNFRWDPHPLEKGVFPQRQHLSPTQKEKVIRQLGGIASQLSNLRFNELGSLFQEAGEYRVGKCLSPAFVFHDRETLGDIERGPFKHDDEYYQALVSVFFNMLKGLGSNTTFSSLRFQFSKTSKHLKADALRFLGHFLQRMIPFLRGETFGALSKPVNGFPLCHPDLSASNIFVDSELNITCVIDWAFASTVPISTALMTPGLPHPRDGTEPYLDLAFKSGFTADRPHDEVKLEISLWECTRRAWLFTRLVLLDGLQDYYYFKELYTSVYKPTEEVNISTLFKEAQKEDSLVELAEALADDEEWAPEILKDEEEYFSFVGKKEKPKGGPKETKLIGIERHAIARKINMVAGLSHDFVADKRLWHWIEKMKKY